MTALWILFIATCFVFIPNFGYLLYKAREHRIVIVQEHSKWFFKKEYINPQIRDLVKFTILILPIAFVLTLPVGCGYFLFVMIGDLIQWTKKKLKKNRLFVEETWIAKNGLPKNIKNIDFIDSFVVSRPTGSGLN